MKPKNLKWFIKTATKITSNTGVTFHTMDVVSYQQYIGKITFGEYNNNQGAYHIGFYIQWLNDPDGILRQDLGYWARQKSFYVTGRVKQ